MISEGQIPPPPIPVDFLVDTGATISWIDEMYTRTLSLAPRSWDEKVYTVTGKGVAKPFAQYELSLVLGGLATPDTMRFECLVGGDALINNPFHGLLGRDVLDKCRLFWNGPGQQLKIEYQ